MKAPLALIGLLALSIASAAHALHCGNRIVVEGDHKAQVLLACGEPELIDAHAVYLHAGHRYHGLIAAASEIVVETWVYNFGPHRLMRLLHFENGRLQSIETLGYGY